MPESFMDLWHSRRLLKAIKNFLILVVVLPYQKVLLTGILLVVWFLFRLIGVRIRVKGDFKITLRTICLLDHKSIADPFWAELAILWWRIILNIRYWPVNLVKDVWMPDWVKPIGHYFWCIPVPARHDKTKDRKPLIGQTLAKVRQEREVVRLESFEILNEEDGRIVINFPVGTRTGKVIDPEEAHQNVFHYLLVKNVNVCLFAVVGSLGLGSKEEGFKVIEWRPTPFGFKIPRRIRREVAVIGCDYDPTKAVQEYNLALEERKGEAEIRVIMQKYVTEMVSIIKEMAEAHS